MKPLFIALALLAGFWGAPALSQTISQQTCIASYESLSAADKDKVPYSSYTANCEGMRKNWAADPSFHPDPDLSHVTGICADNSYTMSLTRASACVNEGGVVSWFLGNGSPPQLQTPSITQPASNEPLHAPNMPPKPPPPSVTPASPPAPVTPASPTTPVTSPVS